MTKISHIIEDQVLQTPRAGALHTSFQYLSRVLPQQQRYARIASTAGGLWLYFEPDVPAGQAAPLLQHPQVQVIDTGGTPLRDYWFVVAYGEGLSMTLLAHEVPALTGHGRFYEG
ncbi:MAG: hypothetical protein KC425_05310, partial [Anaerolineales bacterium]|nr:hypothetical protein [Anaerolineales bacterium]